MTQEISDEDWYEAVKLMKQAAELLGVNLQESFLLDHQGNTAKKISITIETDG